MKTLLLAALFGAVALAPAAHAATEHCDGHNGADVVKVEGQNNDFVPADGVQFCVKASNESTGLLTGDGTTTLIAFVEAAGIVNDNGEPHDVSYYVVYDVEEQGNENPPPPVSGDDEDDDGDDNVTQTPNPPTVTVESDVNIDELSDVEATVSAGPGDTPAGTAGGTTVAGVQASTPTDAASTDTGPQTTVLGETLERGPDTLARTGAGVGGLAALGGLLTAGGFLVRRFHKLW